MTLMPGPNLPVGLDGHEMVAINSSYSMVIGGRYVISGISGTLRSRMTFYYDHTDHHWIDGPEMNSKRFDFAAGIATDEVTMEKLVIVTGGTYYSSRYSSTEVLFENQWLQGEDKFSKA